MNKARQLVYRGIILCGLALASTGVFADSANKLTGIWNLERSGGTPIALPGNGVVVFHDDGTATVTFDTYLGAKLTPTSNVSLTHTEMTWKRIGNNKVSYFAAGISVSLPTGDFPAGPTSRVTCEGQVEISQDGNTLDTIPGTTVCKLFSVTDLSLSAPLLTITGDTIHAVRVSP